MIVSRGHVLSEVEADPEDAENDRKRHPRMHREIIIKEAAFIPQRGSAEH